MACSTTRCKSIDKNGKVRDASDPLPPAAAEPSAPLTPADLPPFVTNSGVTTVNPTPTTPPTQTNDTAVQTPATTAPPTAAIVTVKVYKYDSSRQCGQGKAIALEDMAKQLKNVKVVGQEKQNDGMMRIQMCGAPSGIANVYEIDQRDLKKAVKLGFREWKYSEK